jgi:hypothetical protein
LRTLYIMAEGYGITWMLDIKSKVRRAGREAQSKKSAWGGAHAAQHALNAPLSTSLQLPGVVLGDAAVRTATPSQLLLPHSLHTAQHSHFPQCALNGCPVQDHQPGVWLHLADKLAEMYAVPL